MGLRSLVRLGGDRSAPGGRGVLPAARGARAAAEAIPEVTRLMEEYMLYVEYIYIYRYAYDIYIAHVYVF